MFCMVNRHYVRRKEGERVKELETGLFMVDFCRDRASPFLRTKERSCSRRRHRPETFPSAALMPHKVHLHPVEHSRTKRTVGNMQDVSKMPFICYTQYS